MDLKMYRKYRVGKLSGGARDSRIHWALSVGTRFTSNDINLLPKIFPIGGRPGYLPVPCPQPKPLRFLTLWATTRDFLALGIGIDSLGEAERQPHLASQPKPLRFSDW